jgi:outer membrane protein TolC
MKQTITGKSIMQGARKNALAVLALMLCLCMTNGSSAQRVVSTRDSAAIEEKLVELALNGPLFKASEHQAKIDAYRLKSEQNDWMNLLSFSLNYNDQSLTKDPSPVGYVYPKYFFGLTIPLGTILSRTDVKAARESVEIGKLNREELKRTIRAEVLTKWRQYKAYGELVVLQSELLSDVEAQLVQVEDQFRKATISIEAYNTAQRGRNDERARLINLKLQQDLVRVDIERIIGTSLDTVLR